MGDALDTTVVAFSILRQDIDFPKLLLNDRNRG
jgi:hypothetical protein